jgi:uncharacterized SAM-binding protein YcdF (DUF218 family)
VAATRRRLLTGAGAAVLIAAALLLTRDAWLTGLAQFLVRMDAPARADAVVVLAGDPDGFRVLTAADLVRRGLAPRALVSSGEAVYGIYESELAIRFAIGRGYPAEYFEPVNTGANSTAEEISRLLPELRRRGCRRVLLVTSDYHTRRARAIFERLAGGQPQVLVIGAPAPPFAPASWWRTRPGRKIFLQEWLKTVADLLGL